MQAVDEIVPSLLNALEKDETSATALDGLKQILRLVFHLYLFFRIHLAEMVPSQSCISFFIAQCTNCSCSSPYLAQVG